MNSDPRTLRLKESGVFINQTVLQEGRLIFAIGGEQYLLEPHEARQIARDLLELAEVGLSRQSTPRSHS